MQKALADLPVTWDGLLVNHLEVPAGMDFTPLLQGLPGDMCHCPHWGYVFKGALHIRYTDGREEALEEGHVYYIPPGHTAWTTDKDTAMLILGPEKEEMEVMAHIQKRQEELEQEGA